MSSCFLDVEVKMFGYMLSQGPGDSAELHTKVTGKIEVGAAIQSLCNFVTKSLTTQARRKWLVLREVIRGTAQEGTPSKWQKAAVGGIKNAQNTLVSEAASEFSKNYVRGAGHALDLCRCHVRPADRCSLRRSPSPSSSPLCEPTHRPPMFVH